MKIAAALGVWPFWGWKIINHGGWFTQVKGRSWQKKAFLTVSFMPAWTGYSSWLQNYIAPSVHTSLLQHFYIIYTSLLHHSFSSYVTFILCAICTSPPSWTCWQRVFRLRRQRFTATQQIASPFTVFGWEERRKQDFPGWMVWISALCTCAHTHACRKNRACAFLAGFRVVCCLFYRFPVRNALRASQAVRATDVMVNWIATDNLDTSEPLIILVFIFCRWHVFARTMPTLLL